MRRPILHDDQPEELRFGIGGYFWVPEGSFEPQVYFCVPEGTLGYLRELMGYREYFWVKA